MARQKGQIFAFTDDDFLLAKSNWGENDDTLFIIRKALLQFPMTKDELKQLKTVMTPATWALVKKRVYPDIDPDCPLTELGDIYQTLNNDIKTHDIDDMGPLFEAKQVEIEYLDQQFEFLKDVEMDFTPKIVLENLKDLKNKTPRQQYVDTMARNFLIGFIGPMLGHLKTMAGQEKETVEETQKRLLRDSSK